MSEFTFLAESEADTDRLGRLLAEALAPGTVVALVGTLGAGKTRLAQAIAAALGVPRDEVTSPTFVLVNEYSAGRLPVFHFDAYRLRDEDEFFQLGPEEYFDSPGITLVEWADRVEDCLPRQHLRVEIEVTGDHSRQFTLTASGENSQATVARLHELCFSG